MLRLVLWLDSGQGRYLRKSGLSALQFLHSFLKRLDDLRNRFGRKTARFNLWELELFQDLGLMLSIITIRARIWFLLRLSSFRFRRRCFRGICGFLGTWPGEGWNLEFFKVERLTEITQNYNIKGLWAQSRTSSCRLSPQFFPQILIRQSLPSHGKCPFWSASVNGVAIRVGCFPNSLFILIPI